MNLKAQQISKLTPIYSIALTLSDEIIHNFNNFLLRPNTENTCGAALWARAISLSHKARKTEEGSKGEEARITVAGGYADFPRNQREAIYKCIDFANVNKRERRLNSRRRCEKCLEWRNRVIALWWSGGMRRSIFGCHSSLFVEHRRSMKHANLIHPPVSPSSPARGGFDWFAIDIRHLLRHKAKLS